MNEDRKPRQFFEARPDGGRPKVTYEECIDEIGRELKRMAQDRKS